MKPAWDKLSDKFASSSSVVVADVDCTVEKDVCSDNGVSGYPTIKYFKDGNKEGESYSGGRDYDSLEKFTKDTLEVACNIDGEGCTEKEVAFIAKAKGKGAEYIATQLPRLTKMSKNAKMKAELKQWLFQRLNIIKQLSAAGGKEEL